MSLLLQYLYVIGIFQGILLFSLLALSMKNSNANRILGTWCLFLALYFIGPFISMEGEINSFSSLIGWSYFLPASYGAFLYLYCRFAIVEQKFSWWNLAYFSPLVICWLLNINILSASAEVKLQIVQNGVPNSSLFIISQIVEYLQAFVYLVMSLILLRKYQVQARFTLSNFNPDIFKWLWCLLFLYTVIWLLKFIGSLVNDHSVMSIIADTLIVVMIYTIAMAQWRNPNLFRINKLAIDKALPILDDLACSEFADVNIAQQQQTTKQTGDLNESIRANLLQTVIQNMTECNTFLDNELTLAGLSKAVGISPHHLSEVLNQQQGKNFYQFVNEYRVNYVCEIFKKDDSVKILDLAMTAGFSSKSTFNAVFKQIKGMTPTQYRNNLKCS